MATETKFEKFVRLAEKRIPKMTESMRLVSQLSSNNYETTPDALAEMKGIFDESTKALYEAFDLALPGPTPYTGTPKPVKPTPVTPTQQPSSVPVAQTTNELPDDEAAPAVDHNNNRTMPVSPASLPGESIHNGADYDLPEWKVVREAYDLLLNITSQEELDRAVRLLKRAMNL